MSSVALNPTSNVAVIESSGSQVVVAVDDVVKVPLLSHQPGDKVTLTDLLTGKVVTAIVVEHGRHPKVTGRLFKNKIRASRFPRGHRQDFTSLQITAIK